MQEDQPAQQAVTAPQAPLPGAAPAVQPSGSLDAWMAENPWHPRAAPFLVYLLLLGLTSAGLEWHALAYPILYIVQCAIPLWLLWRYRRLLPELTLSFHWLAIPVAVIVVVVWIGLGQFIESLLADPNAPPEPHYFQQMSPTIRGVSLALRLLGMSLVVPLVEELWTRSLLLRSLHRARHTAIGLAQIASDLPVIGEWLIHTDLGRRSQRYPPIFGREFAQTPLGKLSVFGVAASTLVFMLHHVPRDWAAAVFCGVAYCLVLAATRHKGLGPVIWTHGITNALLWAYSVYFNDWRFF